ncbi:MAG: MotR [Betaproteobacteria bacterium HGW-Betaproteobacteria-22]|nr:MAG: MotR [Betaproteobacteria bacterium HGW-Betaproteobacteria-22]
MASFKNTVLQNDQAAGLRRIMAKPRPRIVSILSATPAQNQARLITNLAASMIDQGSTVLVMHASEEARDAHYQLEHTRTLLETVMQKSSTGHAIKTTRYGFSALKLMHKKSKHYLGEENNHALLDRVFNHLAHQYGIVLVDTELNEAGVLPLNTLNEAEIIIQLTRNPESITEAYRLIKQIYNALGRRSFGIIVDDATESQAKTVFRNISDVAKRFMRIDLEFFGAIPVDDHMHRAARHGRSVIDAFPMAIATAALKQIAQRLDYKHDGVLNNKLA